MLRPYRSVTGRVRLFDRGTGNYVGLARTPVELRQLQRLCVTDVNGVFVFRDLPSGDYTVVVTHNGQEYTAAVRVPDGPASLKDVDVAIVPAEGVAAVVGSLPERSNTRSPTTSAGRAVTGGSFAIQIAALNNPFRAREMVNELKDAGLPAYLVEPPTSDPDAPYRVRLGRYATRDEANKLAGALEKARGQKLWVTREHASQK